MGKYDLIFKAYFQDLSRTAELFCNGVHHKRLDIRGEDLVLAEGRYPSLTKWSGRYERDGIFLCEKYHVKYALETERYPDFGMPWRILTYDACEYERQTEEMERCRRKSVKGETAGKFDFVETKSRIRKEDRYYPVVTLVLYLGQGHWQGRNTLQELFAIPKEAEKYLYDKIQNYTYAVVEADYVNPEDYRTDLRQFFQAMQCRKDKKKLKELFEKEVFQNLNPDAQKMIAVHLGIRGLAKKVVEEEEEMCKAFRELAKDLREEGRQEGRQEGREEGREEGRKEGRQEGRKEGIDGMMRIITRYADTMKCSIEKAMDLLMLSEEDRKLLSTFGK